MNITKCFIFFLSVDVVTLSLHLPYLLHSIPPVRSDYHHTRIVYQMPDDLSDFDNFIVLSDNPVIVLQRFKTDRKYKVITIAIPPCLLAEIQNSLKLIPRDHLSCRFAHEPYNSEGAFNTWANRVLKAKCCNSHISLTTLRHVFITRRDLKLEQDEVAKLMGHSIDQLRKYLWHSWLKEQEISSKDC